MTATDPHAPLPVWTKEECTDEVRRWYKLDHLTTIPEAAQRFGVHEITIARLKERFSIGRFTHGRIRFDEDEMERMRAWFDGANNRRYMSTNAHGRTVTLWPKPTRNGD